MGKIAFVFPGQGTQSPGMGKDLYDNFNEAKSIFDKVENLLDINYKDMCFTGSEEELKQTKHTQPAVYLTSVACYEVLKSKGIKPALTAGHSLGEYAALVASGIISFEDGYKLVSKRGQYMQECAENTEGTMAAIIGLETDVVEKVCAELDGIVSCAAFNSPGQIVISGEINAVKSAAEKCTEQGAAKSVVLEVNGAWHSELMRPALEKLEQEFENVEMSIPSVPITLNFNAQVETNPILIKPALIKQLTNPIRWVESVNTMINTGVETFIEVGPGKVLRGLIKRIAKASGASVNVYNVSDSKTLEKTLGKL